MDSASSPFDAFFHYDSANPNLDQGRLTLQVPTDGNYHVTLSNIYVQHDPNYVPSPATAFIVLDSSDNVNRGICAVGRQGTKGKRGEVAFPLNNPDQPRPSTTVYNYMKLSPDETLGVAYYDDTFQPVKTVVRLVMTIHLVKQK